MSKYLVNIGDNYYVKVLTFQELVDMLESFERNPLICDMRLLRYFQEGIYEVYELSDESKVGIKVVEKQVEVTNFETVYDIEVGKDLLK